MMYSSEIFRAKYLNLAGVEPDDATSDEDVQKSGHFQNCTRIRFELSGAYQSYPRPGETIKEQHERIAWGNEKFGLNWIVLHERKSGKNYSAGSPVYYFKHEQDAMMFRLKWGI